MHGLVHFHPVRRRAVLALAAVVLVAGLATAWRSVPPARADDRVPHWVHHLMAWAHGNGGAYGQARLVVDRAGAYGQARLMPANDDGDWSPGTRAHLVLDEQGTAVAAPLRSGPTVTETDAGGPRAQTAGTFVAATSTTTATPATTSAPSVSASARAARADALRPGPSDRSALRTVGPITITTPGAVVEDVDVAGQITVAANNVTVRNFRANNVVQQPGYGGMLLEFGEIHGAQNPTADGVTWSNYTARFLDVHNVFDAFKAHGNTTIEDCWIHDLNFFAGNGAGAGGYSHNDGVQVSSGSNVVIRNNVFERNRGNAAVFIDADQGPINDVLVERNVLGGGGFTLYSIQSRSAPQFGAPTNVTITNNVFTDEHLFDYAAIAPGTAWSANTDLAGRPVAARLDVLRG